MSQGEGGRNALGLEHQGDDTDCQRCAGGSAGVRICTAVVQIGGHLKGENRHDLNMQPASMY